MINLLLFLFFIGFAGLAAAFIVENPGNVTMVWFDYQIETSVAFIIIAALLAFTFLILLTSVIVRILSIPSRFRKKRTIKQLESGMTELTHSVAALATSNIESAEKHVGKVERLLGKTPLTLLLSAQISKTKGDEPKTQKLLEQLLEHKETEYLAARSLSDSASKQDNFPKALQLAKKAQSLNPKNNTSSLAVISLQVRLKQWDEALANVQKIKIPRREKFRIRALIQLARGETMLRDERSEEALPLANNVIKILPYFAPAVSFTARVYSKNDMYNKAIRIIVKAWKYSRSPLLIDTLNEISEHEPNEKKEKLLAKLSGDVQSGIWTCKTCEHNQKTWNVHCGSCYSFDTLEWK